MKKLEINEEFKQILKNDFEDEFWHTNFIGWTNWHYIDYYVKTAYNSYFYGVELRLYRAYVEEQTLKTFGIVYEGDED